MEYNHAYTNKQTTRCHPYKDMNSGVKDLYFSIVTPVYKVELYIKECIESVLNQDFTNYEFILIDDGSPDSCGMICDEYASRHSNIKVIHKNNEGVSSARNIGVENASGKYLLFLDSDDSFVEGILTKLYNITSKIPHIDFIMLGYNIIASATKKEYYRLGYQEEVLNKSGLEALKVILQNGNEPPNALWRNVFLRKKILNYNLRFNNNLVVAEDFDFVMEYMRISDSVYFFETPLVNYRLLRNDSLSTKITMNHIVSQFYVIKKHYYYYYNEAIDSNTTYCRYFANKFANVISVLHGIKDKKEILQLTAYIKENKNILNHTKGFKYFIAKIVWLFFGYYYGSYIIKILNQIFRKKQLS